MDCESTFSKVTGRAPTSEEAALLLRLRGTWNVRGNEAAAALLFVLHFSSSGYPHYPSRFARAVRLSLGTRLGSHPSQSGSPNSFGDLTLLAAVILCTAAVGTLSHYLATSDTIRWHFPSALVTVMMTRCGWATALLLLPFVAHILAPDRANARRRYRSSRPS